MVIIMMIKLMTYNIQHGLDYSSRIIGKRKVNFAAIIETINALNPDILSINEIYGKGFIESEEYFDQVSYIATNCNFKYYTFSKAIDAKNGEYGSALFSKIPFSDYEIVHIPDPIHIHKFGTYESRVLTKFNYGNFDLISLHVGLNPDEQENAYYTLMDTIDPNKKTLILGDFNMTVDNRFIQNIMKKYNEATIDFKNKIINTYPSIDSKMKIDYIFLSKDIKILDADVLDVINSDHLPIYALITI